MRPSRNPRTPAALVKTEDLVVGDEIGNVYYYSVEWPDAWEVTRDAWSGSMTLLAKISIHTQQICGLSFSYDGAMFATGGNDNLCCLFQTHVVLQNTRDSPENEEVFMGADGIRRVQTFANRGGVKEVKAGSERHQWVHGAAVKAIAFCPWQPGLVATGGGSNDKCIHFYHTTSGACLATISVAAQVTSLMWSTTRREICATFGYAQPEHPYRIAVCINPLIVLMMRGLTDPRFFHGQSANRLQLFPGKENTVLYTQSHILVVQTRARQVGKVVVD